MKRVLRILGKILLGLVGALALFLIVAFGKIQWPWLLGSHPQFRQDCPSEITFSVIDFTTLDNHQQGYTRDIDSGEARAAILNALGKARKSEEHQCANAAKMILMYSEGAPVELWFLPGHDKSRYEFRYSGAIYSMPRAEFFSAMQSGGIEVSRIPGP